jgi:hypothetical protein
VIIALHAKGHLRHVKLVLSISFYYLEEPLAHKIVLMVFMEIPQKELVKDVMLLVPYALVLHLKNVLYVTLLVQIILICQQHLALQHALLKLSLM